jgi:glycosyltransferase involved in cell wall biosynthesis
VVTKSIQENLLRRGCPSDRLVYLPNGANVELFHFSETGRRRIRESLGLEDRFIAIYAGIHGIAQGLETVIQAARLLQADPQIHFLLIGDGPKKAELQALAGQYNLPNLRMLPEQPREQIVDYLSAADVALIPLRNIELFSGALPSKMFDAWACERPLLLSVDGEARRVMEQARGGVFVPPENPHALADALLEMKNSPDQTRQMGVQGRAYTVESFSRKAQAAMLAKLLNQSLK